MREDRGESSDQSLLTRQHTPPSTLNASQCLRSTRCGGSCCSYVAAFTDTRVFVGHNPVFVPHFVATYGTSVFLVTSHAGLPSHGIFFSARRLTLDRRKYLPLHKTVLVRPDQTHGEGDEQPPYGNESHVALGAYSPLCSRWGLQDGVGCGQRERMYKKGLRNNTRARGGVIMGQRVNGKSRGTTEDEGPAAGHGGEAPPSTLGRSPRRRSRREDGTTD